MLQDPGLGKTSETLAALKILFDKKLISKALVLAPTPLSCTDVWVAEKDKWLDFNHFDMTVLWGPKKEQRLWEDHQIYIMNPEGLEWLLNYTKTKTAKGKVRIDIDLARLKKMDFDVIVYDELSLYKHINTNRYKALKHAIPHFGWKWGLTGSPSANGLLDLFGQCYVLDQGTCLGPYITHYRTKYFHQPNPNDMFSWVIQPGKEAEIYKAISPMMMAMKAEDYLTLPEFVPVNRVLTLPDEAYEKYWAMEENLIVEIKKKMITATTSAVASGKCSQIANGGLYLPAPPKDLDGDQPKYKRQWVDIHQAKVDDLENLVNELQGQPLLVAYDYEHDLARLQKRFGKDLPYIGSGVPLKRRQDLCKLWNAGRLPYLFGQPQSMARSLNLQQAGHHVCWHSLTWNFEIYDQFNRRVLRSGNTHKRVFVYHQIAKGTVDHIKMQSLKAKDTTQRSLFAGLKALAQKR